MHYYNSTTTKENYKLNQSLGHFKQDITYVFYPEHLKKKLRESLEKPYVIKKEGKCMYIISNRVRKLFAQS